MNIQQYEVELIIGLTIFQLFPILWLPCELITGLLLCRSGLEAVLLHRPPQLCPTVLFIVYHVTKYARCGHVISEQAYRIIRRRIR